MLCAGDGRRSVGSQERDQVGNLPRSSGASERYAAEQGKRHKKLTDWGRQALLQVARWLPERRVVAVADSSFSAIALLRDLAPYLTVVSRLRKDAALCSVPPPVAAGQRGRGRPRRYGAERLSLAKRAGQARGWQQVACVQYGQPVVKTIKTFLATWRPAESRMASDGSESAPGTPIAVSAGPAARTNTRRAPPPGATTRPEKNVLAPLPTSARVERFINRAEPVTS